MDGGRKIDNWLVSRNISRSISIYMYVYTIEERSKRRSKKKLPPFCYVFLLLFIQEKKYYVDKVLQKNLLVNLRSFTIIFFSSVRYSVTLYLSSSKARTSVSTTSPLRSYYYYFIFCNQCEGDIYFNYKSKKNKRNR